MARGIGRKRREDRSTAIIGMAGRFPGAPDVHALMDRLEAGADLVSEIAPDRWPVSDVRGPAAPRWLGALEDVRRFDHRFFGISAAEAATMDPQQRMLLEETWHCLEDAAVAPSTLSRGRTGVFVGFMATDFHQLLADPRRAAQAADGLGAYACFLANRISHVLGLDGPSMAVDAACASSLVALHLARRSLLAGECDHALVAGVSLDLDPWKFDSFAQAGMLSPRGRSRAFDRSADGYVPGEGAVAMLLRRSDDAVRDGDRIHARILGSAVNHTGGAASITHPSVEGQARLIAAALDDAGVDGSGVGYVEAHGTGTSLGDPIEVEALRRVYGPGRKQALKLGSLKSNIGHLEGAAGLAGLAKVAMMLRRRRFVPTIHVDTENPILELDTVAGEGALALVREPADWTVPRAVPRRAAVSSFGFGGANAHAIVEEAPETPGRRGRRAAGPVPFLLSAAGREGLAALTARWRAVAAAPGFDDLAVDDIAGTLATGRAALRWRVGALVETHDDIRAFLAAADAGAVEPVRAGVWAVAPAASPAAETRPPARFGPVAEGLDAATTEGMAAALDRLALRPAAVVGWGARVEAACAAAEALALPLMDPRTGALSGRRAPDAKRLRRLARDLCRAETAGARVLDKAASLLPHQPTFARLVESWDGALDGGTGGAAAALIAQPPPGGNERGVAVLVAATALRQLSLKWDLPDRTVARARSIEELSALVAADVLPRSAATGLLRDGDGAAAEAGLGPVDETLIAAFGDRWTAAAPDPSHLDAWRACAEPAADLACHEADGDLAGLVLRRWLAGDTPDWSVLYPAGDFVRLELPLYPFQGRDFPATRADFDREAGQRAPATGVSEAAAGTVLMHPEWAPSVFPIAAAGPAIVARTDETPDDIAARLDAVPGPVLLTVHVFTDLAGEVAGAGDLETGLKALHAVLRALVRRGDAARITLALAVPVAAGPVAAGLVAGMGAALSRESGFARIAALEHADGAEPVLPSGETDRFSRWRIDAAGARRAILSPRAVPASEPRRPSRPEERVAVVTGGAGMLGQASIRALAACGWRRFVILGRRSADAPAVGAGFDDLELAYRQCDVADEAALAATLERVRAEAGPIGAVVHAAGILGDGLLAAQDWPDAARVLAPKLAGGLALDGLTRGDPLDLFAVHASVVGRLGNAGQTAYAAANAALDGLVEARRAAGAPGRSLAFDWSFVEDGGMGGPETGAAFREAGVPPLTVAACETVMRGAFAREAAASIVVLGGPLAFEPDRGDTRSAPAEAAGPAPSAPPDGPVAIAEELRAYVAAALGEAPETIGDEATFFELGLTSLQMQAIAETLTERFVGVTPTVLFQYTSVARLADHLAILERRRPAAGPRSAPAAASAHAAVAPQGPALHAVERTGDGADEERVAGTDGAIAIVGMSGRFPLAPDLWAFWDNLDAGRDCIRPVPAARWADALGRGPEGPRSRPRQGGFIEDVDRFDPLFFNLSPRAAAMMDPQQRLSLENVWHTLENAGYGRREAHAGRAVGVYWGTMWGEWSLYAAEQGYLRGDYAGPGSLYWAIPNRISYFMDFSGPSIALDTACSSSLTAIHLACQALRDGDCEMAVAGGINLSLHPAKYDYLAEERFLSSDGRCRSFGEGGDGYVPGEGVASVLLKPLERARADGDNVLGVVLGSAVNHGGRAAGFTAPNPSAQRALIDRAIARAGIAPADLDYVECHGTGTALGDPIEIEALAAALPGLPSGSLPIGSVKSNIGHLEAAAGVAGLIKVLLSLERERLPASLHGTPANTHIPFADTPFAPLSATRAWPRASGRVRHAAISSFGAGGSNAHALLAGPEYAGVGPVAPAADSGPREILISARSSESLSALCARLAEWAADAPPGADLDTAADTLRSRASFPWRFGTVARDLADLAARLREAVAARDAVEVAEPDAMAPAADSAPEALLRVWLSGGDPGPATGARLVSLPGTPFEKERYWLPQAREAVPAVTTAEAMPALSGGALAPGRWRYTAALDGDMPLLRDHSLAGRPVLAAAHGVALVRSALVQAGLDADRFADMVWLRPVLAPARLEIEILRRDGAGGHAFTLSDQTGASLRGVAVGKDGGDPPGVPEGLDHNGEAVSIPANYDGFARCGFDYGASFRTLRGLTLSPAGLRAELALAGPRGDAALPPTLLDGALQAVLAWIAREDGPVAAVPVAIDALAWRGPVPDPVHLEGRVERLPGGGAWRADLVFRDDANTVVASLTGVVLRAADLAGMVGGDAVRGVVSADSVPEWRTLSWQPDGARPTGEGGEPALCVRPAAAEASALAADLARATGGRLLDDIGAMPADAVLVLVLPDDATAARGAVAMVCGALGRLPAGTRVLVTARADEAGARPETGAFGGLLRAAALETGARDLRVVECVGDGEMPKVADWAAVLRTEAALPAPGGVEARWRSGRRETRVETGVAIPPADGLAAPAVAGAWVVTGGLGALGLILARHLARRGASGLALVSRGADAPDAVQRRAVAEIEGFGARVVLVPADVADADAFASGLADARTALGPFVGAVHAAGTTRDSLLRNKTEDGIAAVLAPKLDGVAALDSATASDPLRAFVAFASIAGVRGNVGQADYAYANRYLDLFLERREAMRATGARAGRSVSVDWPLWEEGGIRVDADTAARITALLGSRPLPTDIALHAFDAALRDDLPVQLFPSLPAHAASAEAAPVAAMPDTERAGKAVADALLEYLRDLLAAETGHPRERIDARRPVDEYGLDSVTAMRLIDALTAAFGPLTRVLFFEHPTLERVRDHLLEVGGGAVRQRFATTDAAEASGVCSVAAGAPDENPPAAHAEVTRVSGPAAAAHDAPIAIIGLAGRFPGANDLDAFWRNLEAGTDRVGPVPAARWDAAAQGGTAEGRGRFGAFLDDIAGFEPLIFGIAPKDARLMDPQARMFLEEALHALEDGGYAGTVQGRPVGVFAAAMWGQYELLGAGVADGPVPGSSFAEMANRVSHAFDLTGPSLAVDSMCSSSLAALHLACESLRRGECEMALAGGANLSIRPEKYRQLVEGGFLSSDGRCRAFGEGGDGYVPGEGVAVALLKPLDRALADGDPVRAVIRGSALNHGGHARGYTVPTPAAQAAVIAAAFERSGVAPDEIDYVEAHGTGTSLGDPVEIAGLTQVFGAHARVRPIGSVKSQIGHLEAAAGIAAVCKLVLQFEAGRLAPSLHAETLNANVDWDAVPFAVQREAADWPRNDDPSVPRRAVVSAFGAGGSNAHMILEGAPAGPGGETVCEGSDQLVVLSARTETALAAQCIALADWLSAHPVTGAGPGGGLGLRARAREALADALGLPASLLDEDEALLDLGLDAPAIDRFVGALRETTGVSIRPGDLAGLANVGSLLDVIAGDAAVPESGAGNLAAIAWTLQAGRLALAERVAFRVADRAALEKGLRALANGETPANAVRGRAGTGVVAERADREAEAALEARDLEGVARAWVAGATVDWARLHPTLPPRLRLPGYPFERKPYWFEPGSAAVSEGRPADEPSGGDAAAPVAPAPDERSEDWRRRAAAYEGDAVRLTVEDGVATVTLARPGSHTMFTEELTLGLVRALDAVAANEAAKVVLLRAEGEAFSMGGTPEILLAIAEGRASFTDAPVFYRGLLDCPVPVIAAMAGHAYGGGLLFGLYADMPVLAAESRYAAVFAEYGFSPGMGATLILPERFGETLANELMYSAEPMTGREMAARGATLRVHPRDQVEREASRLARTLARKPRRTLVRMKQAFAGRFLDRLPEAIAQELAMHEETFRLPEVREALKRRFPDVGAGEPVPEVVPLADGAPEKVRLRRVTEASAPADSAPRRERGGVRLRPVSGVAPAEAERSPPAVSLLPNEPDAPARADETDAAVNGTPADIEETVAQAAMRLLQMTPDELDRSAPLAAMGLDSIGAVELARSLAAEFGVVLDASDIYDHPTVTALAAHIRTLGPATTARPAAVGPGPEAAAPADNTEPEASDTPRADDAIAICGMAGAFPGAPDVDTFWANLLAGVDAVGEVPAARWDAAAFVDADPEAPGKGVSRWGGFLSGIDRFDADFFGFSPMEAEILDPQQRLVLEASWHALEDAATVPSALAGRRCGVFMGAAASDYERLLDEAGLSTGAEAFTGLSPSILSARLAYALDLTGPAVSVETACSSSLVAVHQACRALLSGDCEMAIAGGVMTMVTPRLHVKSSKAGMLSPTGRCRPFSDEADGIALSEGVGVVVLKRLADARRDGDPVRAVIRGSGINQDGRTNGITAPSARSQAALLRRVYEEAGIDPGTIGYVETHGTGTALGDPIEFKALKEVFGASGEREAPAILGSVKASIGHATVAAGIAGLVAAVRAVETGEAPPLVHFGAANPRIDFDGSPFVVSRERLRWGAGAGPRRAGVSSFGFSGTNVHQVIEQAPARPGEAAGPAPDGPFPFLLSGRDEAALARNAHRLAAWLAEDDGGSRLVDIARTLACGRERMTARCVVFAAGRAELAARLADLRPDLPGSAPEPWHDLAAAWLAGDPADFRAAFARYGAGWCRLPGYAFADTRFWAPAGEASAASLACAAPVLHPLVHTALADPAGPAFETRLAAEAAVLDQHRVFGRPVLPGAALLAMGLAASRLAGVEGAATVRDLIWPEACEAGPHGERPVLRITLRPEDDGVAFAVASPDGDVHARGRVVADEAARGEPERLEALRARCRARTVRGDELYDSLAARGLDHRGAFRRIDTIRVGAGEALVHLRTDGAAELCEPDPTRLDAVLHGVAALLPMAGAEASLFLPVGLDRARFHGDLSAAEWVHVRRVASGSDDATDAEARFDLDAMDGAGGLVAAFGGFALRRVEGTGDFAEDDAPVDLFAPRWVARTVPESGVPASVMVEPGAFTPLAETTPWALDDAASAWPSGPVLVALAQMDDPDGLYATARRLILMAGEAGVSGPLTLAVDAEPAARALAGFARSLAFEMPRLPARVALAGPDADRDALCALAAAPFDGETLWRIEGRTATVHRLVPVDGEASGEAPSGVWLVTGGFGGLGGSVAVRLARHGAQPVLVGRGAPPPARTGIATRQADVTDPAAVAGLVATVEAEIGPVTGLVHLAATLRDGLLAGKAEADWSAVIAPKIHGLETLLAALDGRRLQAVVVFSSLAATQGHLGQTDYAFANGWLDGLAAARGLPLRSIAWPWWRAGGMTVEPDLLAEASRRTGIAPVDTAAGLDAFERALATAEPYLVAAGGKTAHVHAWLGGPMRDRVTDAASPDAASDGREAALVGILGEVLVELLKIDPATVRSETPFSGYGLESITLTRYANRINRRLAIDLSPAVLFEADTIARLAARIGRDFPDCLPAGSEAAAGFGATGAGSASAGHTTPAPDAGMASPMPVDEPIAIVGMAARMPGSDDLEDFWRHIAAGDDLVSEIPAERWDWREFAGEDAPDGARIRSRWGGFIDDVDRFDAAFFGISPREAELLDPQQRLFLQTVWHALEDAGIAPSSIAGSDVGMFVGVATADYLDLMLRAGAEIEAHLATGMSHSMLPNRISYLLDLHGPSEPVDTACSSSLVALARAVEAIRRGDCSLAVAGGVNLILSPTLHIAFDRAGMLSPTGRCRVFDADADGYVRGEGGGAVVLKPLSHALADGDPVHGVIRGIAVAHGGRASSLTAPNPNAQAALIERVVTKAGVDAADIGYIEAHGTGTPLGDPVEIGGLSQAFAALGRSSEGTPCAVGSIKSNVGHLEAAAGVAGLVKVLLALRHGTIPGQAGLASLNPHIRLAGTPFEIAAETRPWPVPDGGGPRLAGLSSFGFGGANVHAVIAEAPARPDDPAPDGAVPVVLSARTPAALDAAVAALDGFLGKNDVSLAGLAWTLQSGREAYAHRLGFLAESVDEVRTRLAAIRAGDDTTALRGEVETGPRALPDVDDDAAAMLRAWIAGAPVDWRRLWRRVPVRVSLPGTVFEGKRFWAAGARPVRGVSHASAAAESDGILFRPVWSPVVWHEPAGSADDEDGAILAIRVGAGADGLLDGLRARYGDVLRVLVAGEDDIAAAVRAGAPRRVYLLDADTAPDDRAAGGMRDLAPGATVLFETVRALPGSADGPLHLALVVAGATGADGTAPIRPSAAAALGLARAVANEYPAWSVRAVDLLSAELPSARILAAADDPDGPVVRALDADHAWHAALVRVADMPPHETPFAKGGVHVILGGGGGIARALAPRLAARTRGRIALIGRRSADAAVEGSLEAIRAAGGEAMYLRADATDVAALTAALDEVSATWEAPDTVIDAVMVLDDVALARMSPARYRTVFESRARTAVALEQALTRLSLCPALVHMSSVQAFLGNPGQANYAAACTFLDAWAASSPLAARVVNWGFWGSVGAVAGAERRAAMAAQGIDSIEPDEGLSALETLIAGERRQLVAAKGTHDALARIGVEADDGSALDRMSEGLEALEALIPALVARRLAEAGIAGEAVAASRAPLFDALSAMTEGVVPEDGPVDEALSALGERYPALGGHLRLLEAALTGLPDVLTGAEDGTGIVLPGGSLSLVEAIYAGNPVADALNLRIARTVAASLPPRGGRVLEVGAGTGGTTGFVLDALATGHSEVDYCYTDLSEAFTRHGWRRFVRDHPGMRFEALDIERDPVAQGFPPGGFDVIVGANVVHATADVVATLDGLRRLLAPGGVLVLGELTRPLHFNTVTFGLLPGWWRSADTGRRLAHSPLLDTGGWAAALKQAGFEAPRGEVGSLGLSMLTARMPQTVKQGTEAERAQATDVLAAPRPAMSASEVTGRARVATGRSVVGLRDRILAALSAVLRIDTAEIDTRASYIELGVDSILAAEVATRLSDALGVPIKPTELYNHPSVEKLEAHLAAMLPGDAGAEGADDDPTDAAVGAGPEKAEGAPDADAALLDLLERLERGEIGPDEARRVLGAPHG